MAQQHYLRGTGGTRRTPQSAPLPGETQVQNSAGGYVYPVDKWVRLERFLILGAEGGSYYAGERKLTRKNAQSALECIQEDGARVVRILTEISHRARAPRNDEALFILAMVVGTGSPAAKRLALDSLPQVARIGTHLHQFMGFARDFTGRGRMFTRGIENWYASKHPDALAYQMVKYQRRYGWSHRDILRLIRPTPHTPQHDALYAWAVGKGLSEQAPECVQAFEAAKGLTTAREVADLITAAKLPREALPTQWLRQPLIWEALLPHIGYTALLRNLANLTRIGVLKPLSEQTKTICDRLQDAEFISKSRIHPVTILVGMLTYAGGFSQKTGERWTPIGQINEALEAAFYTAFDFIEPTDKRWLLALDVSGSMGQPCRGLETLSARTGAAVMAMTTLRTETAVHTMAFSHTFRPLALTRNMGLNDVTQQLHDRHFGGTDCAIPMVWALNNRIECDVFVVYTDHETWYGDIHPMQALRAYRDVFGIPAKFITVGMVSNGFSIADSQDGGAMDVIGFDTAAPAVMADFVRQPKEGA